MKKVILASLLIFNIGVYADDLVCMGNTNNGQLIQLNLGKHQLQQHYHLH